MLIGARYLLELYTLFLITIATIKFGMNQHRACPASNKTQLKPSDKMAGIGGVNFYHGTHEWDGVLWNLS